MIVLRYKPKGCKNCLMTSVDGKLDAIPVNVEVVDYAGRLLRAGILV